MAQWTNKFQGLRGTSEDRPGLGMRSPGSQQLSRGQTGTLILCLIHSHTHTLVQQAHRYRLTVTHSRLQIDDNVYTHTHSYISTHTTSLQRNVHSRHRLSHPHSWWLHTCKGGCSLGYLGWDLAQGCYSCSTRSWGLHFPMFSQDFWDSHKGHNCSYACMLRKTLNFFTQRRNKNRFI